MFEGSLRNFGSGGEYVRFLDDELPEKSEYQGIRFKRCLFHNIGLKKVRISEGSFQRTRFVECYIPHGRFERVDFTGCEFIDCNLRNTEFINCILDYATFKGCELDYKQIIDNNKARWQNTRWRLIRSLRLNAQGSGDSEAAIGLLLEELGATRSYLKGIFLANDDYHRQRYGGKDRLQALWSWILHQIQFLAWGYGLRPMVLLRNGVFATLLAATTTWLSHTLFHVPHEGNARCLCFGEALYVSVVTFTTLGYGDFAPAEACGRFIQASEAVLGAIFLGLFAATAFRRIGR